MKIPNTNITLEDLLDQLPINIQFVDNEGFVRYLLENLPPFMPEYVNIKRVNAGLLAPSEDEASQLELGKNVCGLAASGNCNGDTK